MSTLFISDLHLCDERPDKLDLFTRLLRGPARNSDALYMLGDLFEAWAGDDDRTSPHPEIIAELSAYTRAGGKLFIIRGNRDFLIGRLFAENTGATILADPSIIDLYGTRTLIMHGDTLCTRDVKYQVYRRLVNNRFSIRLFLMVPYTLREKIWHGIRNVTRATTARKSPEIVDVHQPAVENVLRNYAVRNLIHGHTHKQGVHEFSLDGITAKRLVLGDWYVDDSVLVVDESSIRMMRVEEYLNQ